MCLLPINQFQRIRKNRQIIALAYQQILKKFLIILSVLTKKVFFLFFSLTKKRSFCTNQQPPQRGGAVPDHVWVGSKWLLAFPRVPVTHGTPLHFFALLPPEQPQEGSTQHLQNRSPVCTFSSLLPYSCLLRLLILLLLLMSGNVHPNPGPIFPCSVCAGNVTWRGKSVLCCTCSKWVHLRCLQLSLSKFRALGSSHSWSCLPCRNTVAPSSDSSDTYTSTVQSGPPSTDAALSRHPRLQTSYPSFAHSISPSSAPSPPTLAPGHFSTPPASSPPPDSLRFLQWNAGGLRARSTELLHFLSSHLVDLICIQEYNLNSSSSFRIPGFSALRSDRTHSRSGILSSDTTHASGGVIIFVRHGLSFSELSTSSLSSFDPYSDYVGINISLNNSSSLSFLNVYAPLFAPPQRMAEPIPFLPPFFPPPEISSFWGTSIAITPSGTQEVLLTPAGRKYLTGSSLLTSSPSMTLTHPLFSIAPLAVAPLPTSPLFLLLLLFLAPERCFRTWVLITYQFFYLSLSLRSFVPTSVPLPSIFRKLAGMALPLTLTLTVPQQRNTRLFLFPLLLLSLPLTLNAAKFSISFGRIKRHLKTWWSAEVEQAVSDRRKAFAAAHRSDEDRQAYISASRRASSVIAKAKAEAWQTTCSSLSPRSNPKSAYSLLRSIAGFPSSSSSSPNFPNCSSPRESASVYAAYLRSHFSVCQPKALRSRARGYLFELRRATCPVESHSSFCSPFSPAEFLAAASNFTPSTATGPDKVAYPMLKHLPRSGMDLLLYIFNLFWSSHTFLSFHLEDIFHYSHPQDGKASRLSCFLPAYLSHLLRIKAF